MENFWKVLEGKIGKILNILGSGLPYIATYMISILTDFSAAQLQQLATQLHTLIKMYCERIIMRSQYILIKVCSYVASYCSQAAEKSVNMDIIYVAMYGKPEPNMFKILPILPSSTFQKFSIILIYSHIIAYYSHIILSLYC